jgi:glycosyltransferase involved in cell wall biosynthesis
MIALHADLRCLQDPNYSNRGVGHLTRSLLRGMPHFAPEGAVLIGIVDPALPALSPGDRALIAETLDCGVAPRRTGIFVQPSPMTHRQEAVLRFLRDRSVTKAAIVYDFIPYDEPTHYLPSDAERIAYRTALLYLAGHDLLFPISDYSGKRLIDLLAIDAGRVFTIGAPVRQALLATATPVSAARPPYFLAVAGDDWRKNIECVIAAFGLAARDASLVVVGPYSEARQQQLVRSLSESLQGRVRFSDNLSDAALAALYAGAIATICPSRVEGFSLPIIEALACGSPVLASECAAQVELLPDRDALFSPDDAVRLAGLMNELIDRPSRRKTLLSRQRPIVARFAENAVAENFWRPIFAAHGARTIAAPAALHGARPRLAFLTPYPPDASGVADYSARSFVDIARHADIELFTDAPIAKAQPGVTLAGAISSFPYFSRRYDRVVSVVGNSSFHVRIVEYVRDFGGACIQHDNRMADFYIHLHGYDTFRPMAERALKRPISRDEAYANLIRPAFFGTLFFDEIVHAAAPFMVHSPGIARNIKTEYGVDAVLLPFCPYRDFSDDELSDPSRAAARARLGIAPGKIVIATFGMIHGTKLNAECIEVLALLRARRIDAELYFVGETNNHRSHLNGVIRALGMKQFVHFFPERPSEATFRDFLLASDVGIQLRTTGLGGLSGALLDLVGAGMAGIANDDLAEAMVAPAYIRRVPDNVDGPVLADRLVEILAGGAYRSRVSAERAAFAAARSFANYARQLMAALDLEPSSETDIGR